MANKNHKSTGLVTTLFNAIKQPFLSTKKDNFMNYNNHDNAAVKSASVHPVKHQNKGNEQTMFNKISKIAIFTTAGSASLAISLLPAFANNSRNINLPFGSRQTWYVCQGYQGPISHGSYYALDLTVSNKDFGSTACWANDGNTSKSAGQPLLAPAAGTIYHVGTDLVCLSIDKNRSLLLGHINRSVRNGATVRQNDVLGYISRASSVNGGFSHIHLEGRKSANCARGTSVPLTGANGFQLNGVGDLPDIRGTNDYFKRALTRP